MPGKSRIAVFIAAASLFALPIAAHSQDSSTASQSSVAKPKKSAPLAKKHAKVWTNDDQLFEHAPASSPSSADNSSQSAPTAAKKSVQAKTPPPRVGGPPALSDPKTPDQADSMIAWEDRDIAAQEQGIADLQKRLDSASPDQKDSLQRLIQNRTQVLAQTRKEEEALKAKKDQLQKSADDAAKSPSNAAPQQ